MTTGPSDVSRMDVDMAYRDHVLRQRLGTSRWAQYGFSGSTDPVIMEAAPPSSVAAADEEVDGLTSHLERIEVGNESIPVQTDMSGASTMASSSAGLNQDGRPARNTVDPESVADINMNRAAARLNDLSLDVDVDDRAIHRREWTEQRVRRQRLADQRAHHHRHGVRRSALPPFARPRDLAESRGRVGAILDFMNAETQAEEVAAVQSFVDMVRLTEAANAREEAMRVERTAAGWTWRLGSNGVWEEFLPEEVPTTAGNAGGLGRGE